MGLGALNQEEIYRTYREKVLGYLIGKTGNVDDAEDLCGDVFEQVFRSLPRYDEKKASLSTWIYRITQYTFIDYLRTKHMSEALTEELPSEIDIEENLIKEDMLERLADAMKTLDSEQQDIIVLRYYRGYSLTEISRFTGISYGMVKVKHGAALKALKLKLE